jgi:hypothetical protein
MPTLIGDTACRMLGKTEGRALSEGSYEQTLILSQFLTYKLGFEILRSPHNITLRKCCEAIVLGATKGLRRRTGTKDANRRHSPDYSITSEDLGQPHRPVLLPRQRRIWQGAPKPKEHAMSQNLNSAVAVIGIDIGKNSFHGRAGRSRRHCAA